MKGEWGKPKRVICNKSRKPRLCTVDYNYLHI